MARDFGPGSAVETLANVRAAASQLAPRLCSPASTKRARQTAVTLAVTAMSASTATTTEVARMRDVALGEVGDERRRCTVAKPR